MPPPSNSTNNIATLGLHENVALLAWATVMRRTEKRCSNRIKLMQLKALEQVPDSLVLDTFLETRKRAN